MSDKDSLFGSPPPSPRSRGRSPSLALPESSGWRMEEVQSSSQNVGTIALPGSHNIFSELPVLIQPALPSERPVLHLRPPAQRVQVPARNRTSNNTPRPTTHRPTPHKLPSVPHNERTDRTLRDLVGLISHFEPAPTVAPSRPPPILVTPPQTESHPLGSQQNPIEIDLPGPADAVNNALIALAGTVASALKLPTAPRNGSSLSEPTVNNVLHCIKHDPKLIPTLQATYEYLGSIPKNPPQQQYSRSFDDAMTKRKRKRKHLGPKVPAGAEHWDVPFPFAPGQEPNGYPSQWQLERGRRVLGELLGLFERGFAKMRGEEVLLGDASSERAPKRKRRAVESTGGGEETLPRTLSHRSENSGLDAQRMADWLSSVPTTSISSGIMDSTNVTPPQLPSTFESSSSTPLPNTLFDFMAMLDASHAGNEVCGDGKTDDFGTYGAGDKTDDFDYLGTFDNLEFPVGDDMAWQSLLDSIPTPQSSTPALSIDMPLQESSLTTPILAECDPILMAMSQPQPSRSVDAVPQTLPAAPTAPLLPTQTDNRTAVLRLSPLTINHPDGKQTVSTQSRIVLDHTDAQSADAQSLLTVPTETGSNGLRKASPDPCVDEPSSVPKPTRKMQRRDAVLAMALEHRDLLVRELERVKIARWELLIEGGVIRNLEKATNIP